MSCCFGSSGPGDAEAGRRPDIVAFLPGGSDGSRSHEVRWHGARAALRGLVVGLPLVACALTEASRWRGGRPVFSPPRACSPPGLSINWRQPRTSISTPCLRAATRRAVSIGGDARSLMAVIGPLLTLYLDRKSV